ncbi:MULTISPECIES: hypothetical protein [unclassified Beijerinckia]|uniref:hypothetical protein n=1 Tax=unclassified Beijerinckia TaxID=2638183 RepID=UPI000B823819|nr:MULTISPECIES: hypothetical protein [unclassified Beijerinckia]
MGLYSGLGICLAAGALAWAVDTWLRLPLQMPGWRGLIVMALFVTAARMSGRPWAASAAACTAAVLGFATGSVGPHGALIYLLPGLVIDSLALLGPAWRTSLARIGLAAGVANASKFVAVLAFGGFSLHGFGGGGVLFPLFSHVLFGMAGGILAAFLLLRARR